MADLRLDLGRSSSLMSDDLGVHDGRKRTSSRHVGYTGGRLWWSNTTATVCSGRSMVLTPIEDVSDGMVGSDFEERFVMCPSNLWEVGVVGANSSEVVESDRSFCLPVLIVIACLLSWWLCRLRS